MRANRERGEHGTENAGSCSGPNGEASEMVLDEACDLVEDDLRDGLTAIARLERLRKTLCLDTTIEVPVHGEVWNP